MSKGYHIGNSRNLTLNHHIFSINNLIDIPALDEQDSSLLNDTEGDETYDCMSQSKRWGKKSNMKQKNAANYLSKVKLSLSFSFIKVKLGQSDCLVTPPKSKFLPTAWHLSNITSRHPWVYVYITDRNLAQSEGVPCSIGNHKIMILFWFLVLEIWRFLW